MLIDYMKVQKVAVAWQILELHNVVLREEQFFDKMKEATFA